MLAEGFAGTAELGGCAAEAVGLLLEADASMELSFFAGRSESTVGKALELLLESPVLSFTTMPAGELADAACIGVGSSAMLTDGASAGSVASAGASAELLLELPVISVPANLGSGSALDVAESEAFASGVLATSVSSAGATVQSVLELPPVNTGTGVSAGYAGEVLPDATVLEGRSLPAVSSEAAITATGAEWQWIL